MTFSDYLTGLMASRGLNKQKALADAIGTSTSQVSRWLAGANPPGPEKCRRIAWPYPDLTDSFAKLRWLLRCVV